ncbi:MAG: hypothetical protein ACREA0_03840, partial [bacterium]
LLVHLAAATEAPDPAAELEALRHSGIISYMDPVSESAGLLKAYAEILSRSGATILAIQGIVGLELNNGPLGEPIAVWAIACPGINEGTENEVRRRLEPLDVYFVRAVAPLAYWRSRRVNPIVEQRTAAECPQVLLEALPPPDAPVEEYVRRGIVEEELLARLPDPDGTRLYEYARARELTRYRRRAIPKVIDAKVGIDRGGEVALRVYVARDWGAGDATPLQNLYRGLNVEIEVTDSEGVVELL